MRQLGYFASVVVFVVAAYYAQGRGFIVLLAGGGILQKPAASKTGSSSRTRPGMLPSIILPRNSRAEMKMTSDFSNRTI